MLCVHTGSFYPFFIYGAIALGLSCVMVGLPFLVAPSRVDMDKTSAYECGFDAFGEVGGHLNTQRERETHTRTDTRAHIHRLGCSPGAFEIRLYT